jgi:maltooligosyltrehalose synthase
MSDEWIATYRLQLHAGFPLSAAERVLPHIAALGASHVYLSPCLQAVPGSEHGYDVADPSHISDELGGEAAWEKFIGAANLPLPHGLWVNLFTDARLEGNVAAETLFTSFPVALLIRDGA